MDFNELIIWAVLVLRTDRARGESKILISVKIVTEQRHKQHQTHCRSVGQCLSPF